MRFTKITGAFAVLFAAAAAAPAPSSTTSADAIHASTLPEAQRLYQRVYTESLMGLLSNVSEAELETVSASTSSSAGRPRRVKPNFKRELVDKVTTLAVRMLLPPSINITGDWPWEYRDWAAFQIGHVGDDIRHLNPDWQAPVEYTAQPDGPLYNRTTCPYPLLEMLKVLDWARGVWNWTTCPPRFIPLPWPVPLNYTFVEEQVNRAILPRGELGDAVEKEAPPMDLRTTILEQANMAGFSPDEIDVVDKTIDDAEEIVYAAQIRATNVMHNQYGSSYEVTERTWCPCKLVGCKSCPNKVKVTRGVQGDEADAIMEAFRK